MKETTFPNDLENLQKIQSCGKYLDFNVIGLFFCLAMLVRFVIRCPGGGRSGYSSRIPVHVSSGHREDGGLNSILLFVNLHMNYLQLCLKKENFYNSCIF